MYGQLPLFEGETPEVLRATITGSCDSLNDELPAMKLGQHVVLVAKGTITKVTHATTGNGLERQHVAVLDGVEWLAVDFDTLVRAARLMHFEAMVDQDDDGDDDTIVEAEIVGSVPFGVLEETSKVGASS